MNLKLDHNSTTPIYMQVAAWLEVEILKGNFDVDDKVYSQYQLAEMFQINPATAAKGLTLLGQEEILYDRRGLGKFVSSDALSLIKNKRKNDVLINLIEEIVMEASHLQIEEAELIQLVKQVNWEKGEERNDN